MKFNHILAALLLPGAVMSLQAQEARFSSNDVNLYDMNVSVDETARKVDVKVVLDLSNFRVKSEREMVLTPMIISADRTDSIMMNSIVVAGRNRWYHYMRDGELEGNPDIYRSGTKGKATYSAQFPLEPWMTNATVEMRGEDANCCDAPRPLFGPSDNGTLPLAKIDLGAKTLDVPFVFAPPVDDAPVTKAYEGSAFVTFVVNRTELKPDYMRNPIELRKILNSIDIVRNDKEAELAGVHFKGYASPEGSYRNNVRLAEGRTETLRRYVRDLYKFSDKIVTSSFTPEDWDGLRSYVKDSLDYNIEHRPEILGIIDSDIEPDEKDNLLKRRFPEDYKVMLTQIYPWLRHSDYTVKYTIKIYTDINDIRRVFGEDPSRLRPVDFFTLAQSYPVGSKEYSDVFLKGVEVYPDDPMMNLNVANIDIRNENYDAAQSHLLRAGNTPQANYARGILAARRQDFAEAIRFFDMAKAGGVADAAKAAETAQALQNAPKVTYLIRPSSWK